MSAPARPATSQAPSALNLRRHRTMGWTLGSKDHRSDLLRRRQLGPAPGAADGSAFESTSCVSYRESAADPNIDNYALDLSASVRR